MADLQKDISDVQLLNNKITETGNKVARFAYSSVAYDDNIIDGVQEYNFDNEQNVPVSTAGNLTVSDTLLDKGIRSQGSSIPRMFLNGMLGRASYNLNKAQDFLKVLLSSVQRSLTRDFCLYSPTAQYQYLDGCYMNYPGVEAGTLLFKRISSGIAYLVGVPPIKADGTIDSTNWTVVSTGDQITDTGDILTPTGSSTVNLTNTAVARSLSAGLWIGQTIILFNNTANTITVTDGSFSFTVLANDKRTVLWTGTRWIDSRLYLNLTYKQYQTELAGVFDFREVTSPWSFYGTDVDEWEIMFENSGSFEKLEGQEGSAERTLGVQEGGAPNITGWFIGDSIFITPPGSVYGTAIKTLGETDYDLQPGIGGNYVKKVQLNASWSSEIYGRSEYVTPTNILTRLYRYIGKGA